MCYSHGAKAKKCGREGCTNNAKRLGLCKKWSISSRHLKNVLLSRRPSTWSRKVNVIM